MRNIEYVDNSVGRDSLTEFLIKNDIEIRIMKYKEGVFVSYFKYQSGDSFFGSGKSPFKSILNLLTISIGNTIKIKKQGDSIREVKVEPVYISDDEEDHIFDICSE